MITAPCVCGATLSKREADVYRDGAVGPADRCDKCGRMTRFVAAEELPDGSGAGDFDTALTVIVGPPPGHGGAAVGTRFVLGGVPEIHLGKRPECHVHLPGERISRLHARLLRADFGPGQWYLENNKSTNGLYVNGRPADAHELADGDVIRAGEYQLQYAVLAGPPTSPPRSSAKP